MSTRARTMDLIVGKNKSRRHQEQLSRPMKSPDGPAHVSYPAYRQNASQYLHVLFSVRLALSAAGVSIDLFFHMRNKKFAFRYENNSLFHFRAESSSSGLPRVINGRAGRGLHFENSRTNSRRHWTDRGTSLDNNVWAGTLDRTPRPQAYSSVVRCSFVNSRLLPAPPREESGHGGRRSSKDLSVAEPTLFTVADARCDCPRPPTGCSAGAQGSRRESVRCQRTAHLQDGLKGVYVRTARHVSRT
ncbi:hypothetical protein BJ166DRAFT_114059 [Pestalotiopsis sp. NC0098]|nr:hypothetical protein BJ166DRAFT_114059 [Pestalotiopsis sp. NC0098]